MTGEMLGIGDKEFKYIASVMYDRCGISLGEQKRVLVAGRLTKRLSQLGLSSFAEYVKFLDADKTGGELTELINRITTNHTFFFREREHFDFLQSEILPRLEEKMGAPRQYPLRIWSAGCASGEEVYSIAMLLREYYKGRIDSVDHGLLATDISVSVLGEAKLGEYSGSKVSDLPPNYRKGYFDKIDDDTYAVSTAIKAMVLFKRLNLMDAPFPMKGLFDVVFCRNVMIYFDQKSRKKVVDAIYRCVKPGGYFFIGHSESLKRDESPFEYVKPAIYRKGVSANVRELA